MEQFLTANTTVHINTSVANVWNALTNPEIIKQYLFGTQAISDWKVGSSLIYKGVWEGKEYEDKGIILKLEPNKILQATYWSSFSGKPDISENYSTVTYSLSENNGQTVLNISQTNCSSEEARSHSEKNWSSILQTLKGLLEQ